MFKAGTLVQQVINEFDAYNWYVYPDVGCGFSSGIEAVVPVNTILEVIDVVDSSRVIVWIPSIKKYSFTSMDDLKLYNV